MNTRYNRPPLRLLTILSLCLVFLGLNGLLGGYEMLINPDAPFGMPLSQLERTLFQDYSVPALLLIVVWGCGSLLTLLAVWLRPQWPLLDRLTRWTHEQWVLFLPVILGLGLLVWLTYQVLMLPEVPLVQYGMYALALLLVVLPLLPSMRHYYES